jgi:hypothetical protein
LLLSVFGSFRMSDPSIRRRARQTRNVTFEVNVVPREPQGLALTQPAREGQPDEGTEPVVLDLDRGH